MLAKVFMVMVIIAVLGVIWYVLHAVIYDVLWLLAGYHAVDFEDLEPLSIEYTNKILVLIGAIYIAATVLNYLLGL